MFNKHNKLNRYFILGCAAPILFISGFSQNTFAESADKKNEEKQEEYSERLRIIGKKDTLNTEAGAITLIDEEQLERFEYDDIHRILKQVPGINLRLEDGYGLRPNIGFRGVTPERSKKINILEDGVLIGPAPYSAPAAYYFPLVSRMTSIEVVKGPSAILFGPNTVAGTINLNTRQVPSADEGMLDISIGEDNYQKYHAYTAKNIGNFSILLEGIHIETDGFKELDTGGDTGFNKNDFTTKLKYELSGKDFDQVFELKLGYADEVSDETYLGLTDNDFAENPNRRYAASQLDRMEWDHQQVQFNHFIIGDKFDVITRVYRNEFERAWRKINGFVDSANQRTLQDILLNPEDDLNPIFYDVLTGASDTSNVSERIVIGTNDRAFVSQGIQSDVRWQADWFGFEHSIKVGLRYHEDQIIRNHTEDTFNMESQLLVSTGEETFLRTANLESSDVWSIYVQDTISLGKWELSAGLRGEHIKSFYQNNLEDRQNDWISKTNTIWLPGISAFYALDKTSGVFAGLHRGFVPTSPQQDVEQEIEHSYSLEVGYRLFNQLERLDLVGFASDFKNLNESCTFSTSTRCSINIDEQYSAGEVSVFGLEASYSNVLELNDSFDMPWGIIYTYTNAEFREEFNLDFELWGDVAVGDKVPYLPENQLTLRFGLAADKWTTDLLINFVDEMNEAAGEGVTLSGVTTDSYWIADLSASYNLTEMGTLYFKIDNLFDEENIVSRRPYGARPNKPRQVFLGYKYRW